MAVDVRTFDLFHTPTYDIAAPSKLGGALTISTVIFCFLCFLSEISSFRHGTVKEMVYLENTGGGQEHVSVHLNITIFDYSCKHVSLDIQDYLGRYEIDEHDTKHLLKENTRNGGCNFNGKIWVRKMRGNFHFTPRGTKTNATITHAIHQLKFGDEIDWDHDDIPMESYDTLEATEEGETKGHTHDYLVKLVRTRVWDDDYGTDIYPYQYTYSHRNFVGHHKGEALPPRVFFRLDFSPLTMSYRRYHESSGVFLSRHLALLAGTFAVVKMFYSTLCVAQDTVRCGKFQ